MKNVSNKEFAWYIVSGLIVAFGIIAMVFGIVGYHMPGPIADNPIAQFEDKIVLDLRTWGIIFMAVGVILAVIVLVVNAKKVDRNVEKKLRREQRISAQANGTIEVKKAVEIVEETKE